jgi:hypothetical protein
MKRLFSLSGGMGSQARMKYGVFGQPVQMACGLEEQNKDLGSCILVCEKTYHVVAAATLAGVDLVRHAITPASAGHGREQAPGAGERSTDTSVYEVRLHADADGFRVLQSGQ